MDLRIRSLGQRLAPARLRDRGTFGRGWAFALHGRSATDVSVEVTELGVLPVDGLVRLEMAFERGDEVIFEESIGTARTVCQASISTWNASAMLTRASWRAVQARSARLCASAGARNETWWRARMESRECGDHRYVYKQIIEAMWGGSIAMAGVL